MFNSSFDGADLNTSNLVLDLSMDNGDDTTGLDQRLTIKVTGNILEDLVEEEKSENERDSSNHKIEEGPGNTNTDS